MVTLIHTSTDLAESFGYNEKKVRKGSAIPITASGYPKELEDLSREQKLARLSKQAALRPSVQKPGVHIFISFDASERLSRKKLSQIAHEYMQGIGFGEQPYLVYQHLDTGVPHLHVVTINIDANGKPMKTSNIGRVESSRTRRELEIRHNLVVADDPVRKQRQQAEAIQLQAAVYGKKGTLGSIAEILQGVLTTYNYTSLPELNALLRQFNVLADRGAPDSTLYQHGGLMYCILDKQGKQIGKAIKASAFEFNPTLDFLKTRFNENKITRGKKRQEKNSLRNAIDLIHLSPEKRTLATLMAELKKLGVDTVLRENEQGRIYGFTFVDHRTKYVFNGRELGPEYGANALLKRFPPEDISQRQLAAERNRLSFPPPPHNWHPPFRNEEWQNNSGGFSLLGELMQPEYTNEQLPWYLRIRGRKKRRGRRGQNRN